MVIVLWAVVLPDRQGRTARDRLGELEWLAVASPFTAVSRTT